MKTTMLEQLNIKKAFTLAEVLITLGIIGVVASLTIPTLIKNYQKEQTVTQLKKVYSELSQAIKMAEVENGNVSNWVFGTISFSADEALNFTNTYLTPYLSISKNCGKELNTCTKLRRAGLDGISNNIYEVPNQAGNSKFILNNGALVWVDTYSTITNIFVDLNGDKKPNIFGKDTFAFRITPSTRKLIFLGEGSSRNTLLNETGNGCNKTAANIAGGYCGALIQLDGWQIKDDYPWD